jgi:hypothetical protein
MPLPSRKSEIGKGTLVDEARPSPNPELVLYLFCGDYLAANKAQKGSLLV